MLDGFVGDRHSAARLSPNTTGMFHHVMFSNSRTAADPTAAGPALGLRTTLDGEPVISRSAAWLQDCTFFNNTSPNPPPVSAQQESRVYVSEFSAAPGALWDETNRVVAPPWKLQGFSDGGRSLPQITGDVAFDVEAEGFISGQEQWLRDIIKVRPAPPPTRPSQPLPYASKITRHVNVLCTTPRPSGHAAARLHSPEHSVY